MPTTADDIADFEKQMRRKVHYVIQPPHLWNSIANLARTQNSELLNTLLNDWDINLQEVNAELVKLEKIIEMARDKHNAFLKELSLPALP